MPSSAHSLLTCSNCSRQFSVLPLEAKLRGKLQVPLPTFCPSCRHQRRLGAINQTTLFRRTCASSGIPIITNLHPEAPYPVYSQKVWYSEVWDGRSYGRSFDFSRDFFPQFAELQGVVPRPALFTDYLRDENSAYTNFAAGNKNCYLIFQSGYSEDCFYGYLYESSKNCMDCYLVKPGELCYEVIDSVRCYNSAFLQNCDTCSDSAFLDGCVGCQECFMCSNLHHKKLHAFNEPVSEEEFLKLRGELSSYKNLSMRRAEWERFKARFPTRYIHATKCERVEGDYLQNCVDVVHGFDSLGVRDGVFVSLCFEPSRDFLDCDGCGQGELMYESNQSGMNGYNLRWTTQCIEQVRDLTYSDLCLTSHDLFGCVGLRRSEYCVLNQQYSREEYFALTEKIVDHMKSTGEWGEMFPLELSFTPYNLSMAQTRYPLTKAEALAKDYLWFEKPHPDPGSAIVEFPDSVFEATPIHIKGVAECKECGGAFKLIEQELKMLQEWGIALPRVCFSCRHHDRVLRRNPQRLWAIKCAECQTELKSTFDPDHARSVLCDLCFEKQY